jgi:hypothetical protein
MVLLHEAQYAVVMHSDDPEAQEASRLSREGDPDEILSFLSDEDVGRDSKLYLMHSYAFGAAASVGKCRIDGEELRFEGDEDELRICCTGDPQHCWNMAGKRSSN